jgi:hypothetical protein
MLASTSTLSCLYSSPFWMLTHKTKTLLLVLFNVSGSVDIVYNPQLTMAGALNTCAKRESAISGHTSNFYQTANITFTGSPPRMTQLWFPCADPSSEIVLAVSYHGLPLWKFVWTEAFGRYPAPSSSSSKPQVKLCLVTAFGYSHFESKVIKIGTPATDIVKSC